MYLVSDSGTLSTFLLNKIIIKLLIIISKCIKFNLNPILHYNKNTFLD